MCGIVGYVGKNKNCIRTLCDGLKRLEYRGYDSSGIAYIDNDELFIIKEKGILDNLLNKVPLDKKVNLGIGHTRWATHGIANKVNAHPHKMGKFVIVHNGIIENYKEIKNKLINEGYSFISDTDTLVISALLDYYYNKTNDILDSITYIIKELKGSYALGIICLDDINTLYAVKNNSPLIIGVGSDENYIASDVPAILGKTNKYIVLEDNDYAKITSNSIDIYNNKNKKEYLVKEFLYDESIVDKNGYDHYMLKEIHEQVDVFKNTVNKYLGNGIDDLINNMPSFSKYNKIRIVACGSATHAGLIGKYMLEEYANIKTEVDIASEFRYNKLFLSKDELVIVISQSGETADTKEALNIARKNGNDTLGIINEKGSTIARMSLMVLYTEAGREIAVATTKAYSSQVTVLSLIALNIAYTRKLIDNKKLDEILKDIKLIPSYMEKLLSNKTLYEKIADNLLKHNDIFFIGRKVDYALALEGSLKLKEISYTHSEAYAAGELKHGTISLIDNNTPVIAIVTDYSIASKTISNIKEVKARGANVIYITNIDDDIDNDFYDEKILIPKVNPLLSSLLTIIPLQLIAYYVALKKECSIDKPRNLAKSVTVE